MAWQLNEVDRILNDPTATLEPHRVWSLLAEIAGHGATGSNDDTVVTPAQRDAA